MKTFLIFIFTAFISQYCQAAYVQDCFNLSVGDRVLIDGINRKIVSIASDGVVELGTNLSSFAQGHGNFLTCNDVNDWLRVGETSDPQSKPLRGSREEAEAATTEI